MAVKSRISLAHLTVHDADPLQLIDAALAGGFDSIGLRIVPSRPGEWHAPVAGDEAQIRRIQGRLRATGLDVLDIEVIWLGPESDPAAYAPALETGARLGAKHVLVVGDDPDEERVSGNVAALCALAAPLGITVMLEFIPFCHTNSIDAAHRVITRAAQPNAGVLIDALHLSRSGASPAVIGKLDPALFSYCQICDARAERPPPEGLRAEARGDRLYPGEGALPLAELLDALPAGTPVAVEAPCPKYASLSPAERGRLCGAATRAVIGR